MRAQHGLRIATMVIMAALLAVFALTATVAGQSPHGGAEKRALCGACHDAHTATYSPLLLMSDGDNNCYSCHTDKQGTVFDRATYEASKHSDKSASETCVKCHNPHGKAGVTKLLRGSSAASVNGTCALCHPRAGVAGSFNGLTVYPGSAHGECTNCHGPHGSGRPAMLLQEKATICYMCHVKANEPNQLWAGDKTFERSAHSGQCLACHNPHGSPGPDGKAYPTLLTTGSGGTFCFTCHPEVRQTYAESSQTVRGSGVTSRHPADEMGSKVKCSDCHNPHVVRKKDQAGYEATLSDPDKPGKVFYWYEGNASVEFCLRCHDGSWPGAPNIAAEIKDKAVDNSGFVRAGDKVSLHNRHLTGYHKQTCASCHAPHATTGTGGVNRGKLLYNMTVSDYRDGYDGFGACETGCHTRRCASCHSLPS